MKRKYVLTLAIAVVVLGLGWGAILHGNSKAASPLAKAAAGVHPPDVKSPVPALEEPPLTRLMGISIRAAEEGRGTTIEVAISRPVAYRVLRLENPSRLVLDLEGARNGTKRWEYTSGLPLLARVRVGRFSPEHGGTLRVVADLEGDPAYRIDLQPTGFRIELVPQGVNGQPEALSENVAGSESGSHAADERPAAPQPVTVALRHDPVLPATSKQPAAGNPSIPVGRPKPLVNQEFPEAALAAQAAQVVNPAPETAPGSVAAPEVSSTDIEKDSRYTGKRISLNLKSVDLKDFFRLIHEVSGLNIIVDPDVSGSVTAVLDDVPWDQALALVLNNNGLGDQLEGNVLRIAKTSTLMRDQQEDQKLRIASEDSAPLVTVFRPVNYAKAATIAALLKTWVGGGALSRRGNVLVDERTNTLIISDIASSIPTIESVVSRLDQKAQQISIEARIIRVTSDFARNLSTALSFAQRNGSGSLVMGGATGSPVSGAPLSPPTVTTASATGFGVFVLSNLGANYAINSAIAAAETRSEAKTISRPSIVTQNNMEGTVIQGTQIPIQTTINNTISVQYVQASLELKVTPQVTEDGHVFLTIAVTNASPGPALTFAGPTINTQSATTQVLVPNGGTVVFGGVTVHTKSNSSSGVPLLQDIPVLGHLFKSTTDQTNDQELLFFVTPKILT